jgi:PD-(D/E)XK nuclease superfamily
VKPFLKELAEDIIKNNHRLDKLTIVFPNRRAALFFNKYLTESLSKPSWSPRLLSIEEFFSELSNLQEPDRLSLIFKLYKVYTSTLKNEEPFDQFYFWGEMLLRDFDEVDKYLIDAQLLFKDLSRLKELDETFDYLTEEQKGFLKQFWIGFEEKSSLSKEEFLKTWRKLPDVYARFTKTLRKEGLGYEGMIHRDVAERIKKSAQAKEYEAGAGIIFAGFNALTKAEETIISHFTENGSKIYWDTDAYYVNDKRQEAGQFIRQYRLHPVLGNTFNDALPGSFKTEKQIKLTGVPQRIGQAKLVGQELGEELLKGLDPEKTVIVLPDESMLLPILHSLPPSLENINVTMGYPLRNTPLYNLLDLLLELHVQRKGDYFSHRQVTAILAHAYIQAVDEGNALRIRKEIVDKNRVYIAAADLQIENSILSDIFRIIEPVEATEYLLTVIRQLGVSFSDRQSFDREYAFHFHRHLSRLQEILKDSAGHPEWRGFQKLFRQVVLSQKIPFTGEPLKGLQVMGVLETRNLDFDNVFVISLNEGMLPASGKQGSYIPHSIRKAYGLPTYEHQDAIYAYLFYRLLQRSERIHLYYNTEPDILGNGEMSRYVQQLVYESGLKVDQFVLHNPIEVNTTKEVMIRKTPEVLSLLDKYKTGGERELTPSALNDFIECRLRFYLKHLAGLKEPNEVEEDLDARVFGNLLHHIIHWFYEDLQPKRNGLIEKEDVVNQNKKIDELIDRAFRDHYHLDVDKPVDYQGQRVIVREIVREFAMKILEKDALYAPFTIELLESKISILLKLNNGLEIRLAGKIDRADRKNDSVRVIDYKTGKDEIDFESIGSLFSREGKRSKSAFQTILYAWLYESRLTSDQSKITTMNSLTPGLMNRKNLFDDEFNFGHRMGKGRDKVDMYDVRPYLPEFTEQLRILLHDLYNPEIPFDQTTEEKHCTFCPYNEICRRQPN